MIATKDGKRRISAEELDRMFDNGDDVLEFFDMEHPIVEHHPPLGPRITLTVPAWAVAESPRSEPAAQTTR
ncbi:antitoxin [Bifidobacterium ramosum]|uniref:Antitoxin n=1 Tax=Bifidobacterium ramosum TaxID=1798158 RepID=A0A6L4WYG5_9BIFI|nr:hypothetical protein [Bifidobacterium ramosum]KAB8286673.1 antitoxin [Bifidobacterium ramosum]